MFFVFAAAEGADAETDGTKGRYHLLVDGAAEGNDEGYEQIRRSPEQATTGCVSSGNGERTDDR